MGSRNRASSNDDHRRLRSQHVISETLDALIRDEVSDPFLDSLNVTIIEFSPDGRYVRVWFEHEQPVEAARRLEGVSKYLRARLADRLDKKRVPFISFAYDSICSRRLIEQDVSGS